MGEMGKLGNIDSSLFNLPTYSFIFSLYILHSQDLCEPKKNSQKNLET